ncbi:hypothetical protein [Sphaerospermopsis sp. LEGE 00249]|uniref:hypothetical protein n=1 Tax=Sphaerospermopsis sp. LEGE 00249 TaxID=1380707 RepID=UPI0021069EF2|nr:hypothetical protein [Sphaerospermopsis sp. LEGE 00249]
MQSGQLASTLSVTIYKTPQKGKGQKLLQEGFQVADFPYNPPTLMEVATLQDQTTEALLRSSTKAIKRGFLRYILIRQATNSISNLLNIVMMKKMVVSE